MNTLDQPAFLRAHGLLLALCILLIPNSEAHAIFSGCGDAAELTHSFSSGASWQLCATVDHNHGLEISSVHYRAPGDTSRSVLEQIHPAQVLIHYHNESDPRAQIGFDDNGRLLPMSAETCDGEVLITARGDATASDNRSENIDNNLCSQIENNGILAKFQSRPALQSERWVLTSALQREGLTWATSIAFAEDGQITPAVTLSGRASLVPVTVLATWRLVFNLDDGDFDQIQQFDFVLDPQQANQRSMITTPLDTEILTRVNREQFRGWRILDSTGSGYYLDPSNSGFNYIGSNHNWAHFDLALTRFSECERYALHNPQTENNETIACGQSLDEFVNNEQLQGTHPVMWFSQSRSLDPSPEHWPVINNLHQSFTLLPYDWTQASPFEVIE